MSIEAARSVAMLERIPPMLGKALKSVRAGAEDLAVAHTELTGVNACIEVTSPAFGYNERIPELISASYLPPDLPRGHGEHRYVFQVFALDIVPRFESPPGRRELLEKIRGHVIAKGLLIGTYGRS